MTTKISRAKTELGKNKKRGQTQEVRLKRQVARKERVAQRDRPARLCSLETVEVRKRKEGLQISVSGSDGRRSLIIASHEVGLFLGDLETAIEVIRSQL